MAKDSRSLWRRIKKWYEGEFIPPDNGFDDDDEVGIVFLMGRTKRPYFAVLISRTIEFSRAHWKWLIGTAIALVGLMIAIL